MAAADTNVLVYAEGVGDPRRERVANRVLNAIPARDFVLPAQVIGEVFRVLSRKTTASPADIKAKIARWQTFATVAPTTGSTIEAALELACEHRLQIFDATILAASAEAGCRILLSEDMPDGFVWRGVTVVNPFAPRPHPLLADLLRG